MTDKFHFALDGTTIPSITEKPVKSLGKLFDQSLRDVAAVQLSIKELETWLSRVDKPRIIWPLLVYNVPVTSVEAMERKICGYLRRWLGLQLRISSAALYGRDNILQLPFKSITEEFKVSRTREALQYGDS